MSLHRQRLGLGLVLAAALVLLFPALALASSEGDHWSLFSLLIPEGTQHHVKEALGHTWFDGAHVGRMMHIPAALLAALISLAFGVAAGKKMRRTEEAIRPSGRFTPSAFVEVMLEGVYNVARGLMEEKWAKASFPLLATLTVFILFSNLLGLIPGLLPPTDNLNTTAAMAVVVFFATHYFGLRAHGLPYFKHFVGPIHNIAALPLMLLMLPIEIISHLARPLSLSIRLMGNMTADHTVLGIFLGFGLLLAPLPIMVLGIIVSLVQTFVFLLLSTVYISMAVEHDH